MTAQGQSAPDDLEVLKAAARRRARSSASGGSGSGGGESQALRRRGVDRASAAPDREAAARAFWRPSERTARLLDQLELQLEELETTATEDELAAEQAAAIGDRTTVRRLRAGGLRASRCRAPAARAGGDPGPRPAPAAAGQAVQARRGRYRDARSHSPPMEGRSSRAREVFLPRLREDQPGRRRRSM